MDPRASAYGSPLVSLVLVDSFDLVPVCRAVLRDKCENANPRKRIAAIGGGLLRDKSTR